MDSIQTNEEQNTQASVDQYNIQTLASIANIHHQLKHLLQQNRDEFITYLAELITQNIECQKFNLIYKDLKESEKEEEQPKLVYKKIQGERDKLISDADSTEIELLNHYQDELTFNVHEIDIHKKRLVFTSTVAESPILCMVEYRNLTKMQAALLSGIFSIFKN